MRSSAERPDKPGVEKTPAGPEIRPEVVRVLRASLIALFCGGVGVSLIAAFAHDVKSLAAALAIALVTPLLLAALRRGYTRLATNSAVVLLLSVVTVLVATSDGIHDIAIVLLPVVIMVAALLLDRRISQALSALAVLSVAAIGVAELTGALHTRLSHTVLASEVAILVFLLSISAVLLHAVARAMYKGIEDAALHEQTYREIFNATSEGILVYDSQSGRIVDVNETACSLTGLSRAALTEASFADLFRSTGGPDVIELATLTRRARDEGPQTSELKLTRRDGREIWLEVALRAATIRGEPRVLATLRDISDRKAVAERLLAAERLQSVGQLAGGVAHDFNNQLTGILNNARRLRDKLRGDRWANAHLDEIIQASNRSADLTRQLLAFARKGGNREEVLDVDAVVQEVALLLERSIDKRVTLTLDLAGDGSARVVGNATFLQSALLNLGLNARDAMPDGGALGFETRYLSADELPAAARAQLPDLAPAYVRVRVSDTGVGIAPELLDRIFEPFFSTKPSGHGMGLAAAYGTVHAHGGALLVESAPGAGTTFSMFLPATAEPLATEERPQSNQPIPPIRVLLAEDERVVGRATEALLQDLGCDVTWCRDGREALDAFERDASGFDLLLLDQTMPGMLGSEVAKRVLTLRPKLPIISTSGFNESSGELPGARNVFLQKPFDLDQLAAALQQALGGNSAGAGSGA